MTIALSKKEKQFLEEFYPNLLQYYKDNFLSLYSDQSEIAYNALYYIGDNNTEAVEKYSNEIVSLLGKLS